MKDISSNKYSSIQASGSFTTWGRSMKDFLHWHDQACKQLLEAFKNNWIMEDRLTHNKVSEVCIARDVHMEVDEALHTVIAAFLEGEARVLAETAEVMGPNGEAPKKSGLELWRLLEVNFDCAPAFNIISVLELI